MLTFSLIEYNNIDGMVLLSDLTKRRFHSINSVIKVGRIETAIVLCVEKDKQYANLSKTKVCGEDIQTYMLTFSF